MSEYNILDNAEEKMEWIQNNIDNDLSLSDQLINYPIDGWEDIFVDKADRIEFIENIINNDTDVYYPNRSDVFMCYRLTRPEDVKVCIIGQDPYHSTGPDGKPTAMGLSFSGRKEHRIPPSISRIFRKLSNEFDDFKIPQHACLTQWADQGIFLLNSSLTVRPGCANSHKENWNFIVRETIRKIQYVNLNIVWILFGRISQTKFADILDEDNCMFSIHPSPMNGNRFFEDNEVFIEVNNMLIEKEQTPINWSLY